MWRCKNHRIDSRVGAKRQVIGRANSPCLAFPVVSWSWLSVGKKEMKDPLGRGPDAIAQERMRARSISQPPNEILWSHGGRRVAAEGHSGFFLVKEVDGGTRVRHPPASATYSYARTVISTAHCSRSRGGFQQEFLATPVACVRVRGWPILGLDVDFCPDALNLRMTDQRPEDLFPSLRDRRFLEFL